MKEQLKLENQLCFRLYTASRLITQAYHPYLTKIGLTYPQYLVMMVLWEQDGQPVNDIARRLYLETNTVTPLLKRMEAEDFITRKKGKDDGRKVIVSLTPKGKALEEQASCIPFEMSGAVACRSITEETAPELYRTMDDLIETLSRSLLP
ncbi:MAG: MarR family transcriptional regulator [Bacteroidales bacterium]|nr:MarR family transcriptional regulator [Bacteroidales bacterium]